MKTKLVYVLTCSHDDDYIEQALVAVYSARYHNPDAHIVLLTDDKTDKLLVGMRGELLYYVTEKIVVPFDADKNMHYRSRWLKTSVRKLIKGDYLFIDCDTITMCDLSHIEQLDAEIAMCRDENVNIADEDYTAAKPMIDNCAIIGFDITKEKYYFNSGVMYVRDTETTHKLYDRWHELWQKGVKQGINLDQPTFAKANIEMGHVVELMEDRWNCIVPTQIEEIYSAYILHFWHSKSFLYTGKVMQYIRENGLTEFMKYFILHPTETFMPSDNRVYGYTCSDYRKFYRLLKNALRNYADTIDATFMDLPSMHGKKIALWALRYRLFGLASCIAVCGKWYRVKLSRKYVHYTNYYSRTKEGK
jgi:lipopolysaccharide biosynthesis glycosyltransferase